MGFLRKLVNSLQPVRRGDTEFDDCDISDDSVLDELYTGLPPR